MIHFVCFCFLTILGLSSTPNADGQTGRGLLWRVVQACVLNHKITGAAFPCLSVESGKGRNTGYAIVRAPNQGIRVVLTPTVRTPGIESERLRGKDAPNYFHDAWLAQHFVTDDLGTKPKRDDLALAVNSKSGRSQDQLHIHVACLRRDIKQALIPSYAAIRKRDWTPVKLLSGVPRYWVHYEPSQDLAGINVFDLVAYGLRIEPRHMGDATIVVVGAEPSGFWIMARKRLARSSDEPHGEALLDPDCRAFKAS